MKLSIVITVSIVGGLLASCCCPKPVQGRGSKEAASKPEGDTAGDGKQRMILVFPNPLPVPRYDQEGIYSCWATSAEMIMEFVGGIRVRQCEQADPPFSGNESICCDGDGVLTLDPDCDSPSLPEFGLWGYDFRHQYQTALTWQQAMAEIDGGRPFAFSWIRSEPSTANATPDIQISHMLVAIGYSESGGQQTLHCLNPRAFGTTDDSLVPFSDYRGKVGPLGTGGYAHEHDYFMIQPTTTP